MHLFNQHINHHQIALTLSAKADLNQSILDAL